MKKAYADTREGQIHYRVEGDGEPIILLHMAEASSDEYTRVIPFLSKKYCAIAMDFLGHGESAKPPYPYQIVDHARTVVNFMDCLNIKKAAVVGHHIGAKIAAELAVIAPERVNNMVLSSLGYWGKTVNNPPDFTDSVEIKPDGSHLMEWWRRASLWGDVPEIVEERASSIIKQAQGVWKCIGQVVPMIRGLNCHSLIARPWYSQQLMTPSTQLPKTLRD